MNTSLPMMRNLTFQGEILIQMIIGDILTIYTMGRQDYLKNIPAEVTLPLLLVLMEFQEEAETPNPIFC